MAQADVCLQEMIDRGFRSPVRSLTDLGATTGT
jgi:hypothetical protein